MSDEKKGKVVKVKTLFVNDSNQKGLDARVHQVPTEIDPATKVVLAVKDVHLFGDPSKKLEMAEDDAMFFTKDPAFVVTDADGKRIQPVVVADPNASKIILGENDIIVQYEELTQEALFKRCKIQAGSGSITKKTPKASMIGFLKETAGVVGVSRGSEAVISEMEGVEDLLDMTPQAAVATNSALSQVALHN